MRTGIGPLQPLNDLPHLTGDPTNPNLMHVQPQDEDLLLGPFCFLYSPIKMVSKLCEIVCSPACDCLASRSIVSWEYRLLKSTEYWLLVRRCSRWGWLTIFVRFLYEWRRYQMHCERLDILEILSGWSFYIAVSSATWFPRIWDGSDGPIASSIDWWDSTLQILYCCKNVTKCQMRKQSIMTAEECLHPTYDKCSIDPESL